MVEGVVPGHFCPRQNTTLNTQGLRKRTGFEVNLALQFEVVNDAGATFAMQDGICRVSPPMVSVADLFDGVTR